MKMEEEINKKLFAAFSELREDVAVPPADKMQARFLVEKINATNKNRPDVLSIVATFLNLKVRLIHVVLIFAALWAAYLLIQKEPEHKQEISKLHYESGLAATNNSTVLCSIQTYLVKK